MKKLYLISEDNTRYNQVRVNLLKSRAIAQGLDVIVLDADQIDLLNLPKPNKVDLLYRVGPGQKASDIEKLLLNYQPTTFYQNYLFGIYSRVASPFFLYQEKKAVTIPFIVGFPQSRQQAKDYLDYLGGLPITVKITGASHGIGVIKIDTLDGLISLKDYLDSLLIQGHILLRKYIEHKEQARLIVLGNQVIASHVNLRSEDFRTNVGEESTRKRKVKKFNSEIEKMAIIAVKKMGIEFAGVDILIEQNTNKPFISEVNFPCYFPTTQKLTNIDIASKMVKYLVKKVSN